MKSNMLCQQFHVTSSLPLMGTGQTNGISGDLHSASRSAGVSCSAEVKRRPRRSQDEAVWPRTSSSSSNSGDDDGTTGEGDLSLPLDGDEDH